MLIPTIFKDFPECLPKRGILHIGAHQCEEKKLYNDNGISDEHILWLEANKDLVVTNTNRMIQVVVSDVDDKEVDFKITNNGESSSILNLKTHLQEHPNIFVTEIRKLKTTTINTLFNKHQIPFDTYDFINLDIQGAELLALKGATEILPYITSIYTEVNEKELYENCVLIPELESFLSEYGFERISISMTQHGWGDALYMRK
jgi:FkbM family methyltransferase